MSFCSRLHTSLIFRIWCRVCTMSFQDRDIDQKIYWSWGVGVLLWDYILRFTGGYGTHRVLKTTLHSRTAFETCTYSEDKHQNNVSSGVVWILDCTDMDIQFLCIASAPSLRFAAVLPNMKPSGCRYIRHQRHVRTTTPPYNARVRSIRSSESMCS